MTVKNSRIEQSICCADTYCACPAQKCGEDDLVLWSERKVFYLGRGLRLLAAFSIYLSVILLKRIVP